MGIKAHIVYVGDDKATPVADLNMTILDVSILHKIPHVRECGGHGRCTTCRVRICDGIQNVSARTEREVQVAVEQAWADTIDMIIDSMLGPVAA